MNDVLFDVIDSVATVNIDHIPTREDIEELQKAISLLPQVESDTEHFFSGGMYGRKAFRAAGTLIVGKVHKKDHLFICTMGEIMVWTEFGSITLKAGDVVESKAGTKRVTYALKDSIGMTVHKTDKIDLDEIEAELIEEDLTSLFDSNNKLKIKPVENNLVAKD